MLFMVIERFKGRNALAVYTRHRDKGRMMPDGLKYLGSWTEKNFDRCFQLMECEDASLLEQWTTNWGDLVDIEVVPVMTGAEASESALRAEGSPER